MDRYFFLLLIMTVSVLHANDISANNEKEEMQFLTENSNTSLPELQKALVAMKKTNFKHEQDTETDISLIIAKNQSAISLLMLAAKQSAINFSSLNDVLAPEFYSIISNLPDAFRQLALNFKHGVFADRKDVIFSSLEAMLNLESKMEQNPYILVQLMRASLINIIFDGIKKTVQNSSLDSMDDKEIKIVLALLSEKKKSLLKGWKHALYSESVSDDKVVGKYIEEMLKKPCPKKELQFLISDYKKLFSGLSESFALKHSELDFDDIKNFNQKFNQELIALNKWESIYLDSIARLNVLEVIFYAITFNRKTGRYPQEDNDFANLDINWNIINYENKNDGLIVITITTTDDVVFYTTLPEQNDKNKE